jgi:uncharacterized protein
MDMSLASIVMILLAGTAAGFFNVVAGGGSLITVPVLIFAGLPPVMANGTNRVAILSQNIMAVHRFRSRGYFPLKSGLILGLSAAVGATVGSLVAVEISGELFKKILSLVMILVLVLTLVGNRKKHEGDSTIRHIPVLIPVFFLIGIYGGFIQAGVGFIVIAAFSLISGTNLVVTNAIKVLVILIYTVPSLIIFIYSGQIAWIAGFTMAAGNICGAWLGAKMTIEKGDRWIKAVLTVTVSAMAVKLFFF